MVGPRRPLLACACLHLLLKARMWRCHRVYTDTHTHTSMTMAVSPSSMSAFARRISLRQHVGLLRKVHRDLADTVSSLFSERSRICEQTVVVVVMLLLGVNGAAIVIRLIVYLAMKREFYCRYPFPPPRPTDPTGNRLASAAVT